MKDRQLVEVSRTRTFFTTFGGINLSALDSYKILPDNTVMVFVGGNTYNLTKQESYQFLRMLGDNRYINAE